MIQLRFIILTSLLLLSSINSAGQTFEIPEGKFEIYWEKSFLDKSRKASSELPFKIETPKNSCLIRMEHGNLFAHVAVPFILDGDTTLLNYTEIKRDEDTGELLNKQNTWFDFKAVGMFEYKGYWVIVYSYPLADPNKYQCYTINTYTKDGKRIDRLPFFKWECARLPIIDISNFEITSYIDEEFEITVQTRGSWDDINTGIYKGKILEEKKKQHYSVYQINDKGMFEPLDRKPNYVVDDENDWKSNN